MKKNEKTDEEFIMRYAIMCRRCNRNALLEYEYEFTCYVYEINVVKTQKVQLSKIQRKKNTIFKGKLTYSIPKIIGICMEINILVQTNNIVFLAAVLTYLKLKKINVIKEIQKSLII